eukprot:COSAG01_NODE_10385_length_2179_cov_2.365865_3_plen_146_part_00
MRLTLGWPLRRLRDHSTRHCCPALPVRRWASYKTAEDAAGAARAHAQAAAAARAAGRLLGRVCVVTGGSTGIGLAIVRALHKEGAIVIAVARDQAKLQRAVSSVGGCGGRRTRSASTPRLRACPPSAPARVGMATINTRWNCYDY